MFLKQHLVVFDKYRNTHAKSIKLGWRFELVNKSRGDLCGILNLNPEQLKDIYTGQNLPDSKRNAYVNGNIVNESGIANYILVIDQQKNITLKDCLESLTPIDEYLVRHPNIYFACKALNYRVGDGKWEGDRALAVYVDWGIVDGKMSGNLIFDHPLQKTGNEIGENVKRILNDLKISNDNFRTLKAKLHDNVKYYEK